MTRILRRGEGRRLAAGLALGLGLALAPHAAAGYERVHTLRWTQPEGALPTGYAAALGSASGQYGETRDLGSIAPGPDGVHRADLVLDSFADTFVVMTAYNGAGSSPTSNEVVVAKAACDATFCEDGNACTADACGETACGHEALPDGSSCVGAAGAGLCLSGTCQAVECLADADCSDGNACNGVEVCAGNGCLAGAAPSCGGETACTVSRCDATLGCLTESKPDGTSCDDGDATTVADSCTAGACSGAPDVVGPPICEGLICEDANACTADACTEGGCTHIALADGTSCDDGDRRTRSDRCTAGVCAGIGKKRRFGG